MTMQQEVNAFSHSCLIFPVCIIILAELFQFEVMDRLFNFNCAAWIVSTKLSCVYSYYSL